MNRRRFLRNSAGLLVPLSFGIIVPAKAQSNFQLQQQIASDGFTAAGGGANNAALVGTNKGGASDGTQPGSRAFAMPSNVTSGNVVLFLAAVFGGGPITITVGMLTKTAGTSTIGAITLDTSVNGNTTVAGAAVYRVPITGNGSLTLTFAPGSSIYIGVAAAEFTGLAASPLDSGGTASGSATTGSTPFTETTGAITTVGNGLIVAVIAEENSTANWTRSNSDSVIFNDSNATTDFTLVAQYRINNATSNAAITSTAEGTTINYSQSHASYKTS